MCLLEAEDRDDVDLLNGEAGLPCDRAVPATHLTP